MNINNPKHAPVHPAAIEFRLYGDSKNIKSHRAKPASHDTGARYGLRGQIPAPPDYTMTGGVTPKKGASNKRIKSFARGPAWYSVDRVASCHGQRSHGARRRERLAKRGQWVVYHPSLRTYQTGIVKAALVASVVYAPSGLGKSALAGPFPA